MTHFGALLAEAANEHGFKMEREGYYAINFVVFVAILVYLLKKPLSNFAASRRSVIMAEMDEARRLRAEAEAKLTEYERRLSNLEAEMEQILAEATRVAEAEKARILAAAVAAAERVRKDAEARLDSERRKLEHELRQKAVSLAMDVAERLITERINDGHRKKLVAEFVTDVEKMEGVL